MYKRSESFFNGYDDTKLFMQKWVATQTDGYIIIAHGQAEHSDCYNRLINGLGGQNWSFIALDHRGHGKSEGIRGYAKDFDEYVLDYKIFLNTCLAMPDLYNKPVILMGHSMGGLIQTCALAERKYPQVSGQVLSSPFFGLSLKPAEWKAKGAGLINTLLPKFTVSNEINYADLTRDLDIIREYEQDLYRHGKISAGVFLGFQREFETIINKASKINLPTMLHISDNDPIVSSEVALKFFDQLENPQKTLKIVEGGKHELYNDINRIEIYKTVTNFINKFKKINGA